MIQDMDHKNRCFRNLLIVKAPRKGISELGVFSAMWSEHCGYKNSRPHLRTLPTEGPLVVQGPGENAGVIDAGDGWGVAFKIESHNHPSAVEPYQGAATGSGGILRDVFTMGARPIAILDSLHFGSLDSPRSRYLLDGVVRGRILEDLDERIRDVRQGPDGYIYLLTDSDDGRILRVEPAGP